MVIEEELDVVHHKDPFIINNRIDLSKVILSGKEVDEVDPELNGIFESDVNMDIYIILSVFLVKSIITLEPNYNGV